MRLQLLVVQVQTGSLTLEAYMKLLEDKIVWEKKMAQVFVGKGKKDMAKIALQRAKIMQKEIESAQGEEE